MKVNRLTPEAAEEARNLAERIADDEAFVVGDTKANNRARHEAWLISMALLDALESARPEADLAQQLAECQRMLEGEHDAHMECHRKLEALRPEAERKMEPWMIDEVIKYLSGKGNFRDDYQGLTVNSSLIRWKDELGPQREGS